MIRAGTVSEAVPGLGQWIFVDLGFSEKTRSCGLLIDDGNPEETTFATLVVRLRSLVKNTDKPINLLIEAPLSVAFNQAGNPTGRSIEKRGKQTRYWYVGLGCSVLVSATYLLRAIANEHHGKTIRLFEGFISFKDKGIESSHMRDVLELRSAIFRPEASSGRVITPDALRKQPSDRLTSAFLVSGMDFGIPPVVIVG